MYTVSDSDSKCRRSSKLTPELSMHLSMHPADDWVLSCTIPADEISMTF